MEPERQQAAHGDSVDVGERVRRGDPREVAQAEQRRGDESDGEQGGQHRGRRRRRTTGAQRK